jgi:hypothetical protein
MRDEGADTERLGSLHRLMRYWGEEMTDVMTERPHVALLAVLLSLGGCGSKKPAQAADSIDTTEASPKPDEAKDKDKDTAKPAASGDAKPTGDGDAKPEAPKKDECTGLEIGNLEETLNKVSCEAPLPKLDDKVLDPKGRLEVKLTASAAKIAPGQHADLFLTLTNKGKEPLPLTFTVDPTPRFEVETYDAKSKRVDMPNGQPPPLPQGVSARTPGEPKGAKITIAPNGSARLHLGWDAVKMKWAPEKVRGTPPEKGYPRAPGGPLAKGKYTVRVVMPLVGVLEGSDKEVSAPKIPIEVGN